MEEHFAEGAVRRGYEIAQMEKEEHTPLQYSVDSGQPGGTVNENAGIDAEGDRTYNNEQVAPMVITRAMRQTRAHTTERYKHASEQEILDALNQISLQDSKEDADQLSEESGL